MTKLKKSQGVLLPYGILCQKGSKMCIIWQKYVMKHIMEKKSSNDEDETLIIRILKWIGSRYMVDLLSTFY